MNKPDRRIEKTRKAIFGAFSDLMQERKYSDISVQQIIDRANVGRTTFYTHFPTKDSLLIESINSIFESFHHKTTDNLKDENQIAELMPVSEIFTHISENKRIIKSLFRSEMDELLFRNFKNYWNNILETHISSKISDHKISAIPIDILSNHITNSLINLVKWWINSEMTYTPQQMEEYYWLLILPCLSSGFDIKELE